jgi:tRNA(Arg) A34 adenosine deaminase TadA
LTHSSKDAISIHMRKIFQYLEIAAKIGSKRDDKRQYWIGAVGKRSDGTLVFSSNGPTPKPDRCSHAEYKLTKKLDYGAIVYVARVLRNGDFAMAKPCANCVRALQSKRVKRVYYTIANNE